MRAVQHSCTLTVRSYECDTYAHVNNAVYLNYLEYARHEFLATVGITAGDMRAAGVGLWVARLCIDYRRPAEPGDLLTILTWPVRRGRIDGVLAQKILRDGETIAEAEVTWVCVDSRGKPTRLPAALEREGLSP
jgi:YbgC/YbaW family acyl-CoA thioester hydrolase